jgi:hypothetical protein
MSFSAIDFRRNIPHFENTISFVHRWMSNNFLSLNPSKTIFLIIGQPQQLAKLSRPIISLLKSVTLSPADSARNLSVIFNFSILIFF